MHKKLTLLVLASALAACTGQPQERPKLAKKGLPAPVVSLKKLIGAPAAELKSLEELKGKVVVLEFWATWCDACLEELPRFNALVAMFKDRPVRFISITDEPETVVRDFLREHPVGGWVGLDDGAAFAAFSIRGRPMTVILARDGSIVEETFPALLAPEMIEDVLRVVPR